MRHLVLFLTFALGAAAPAFAQSSIRPGGQIQGGPGRVASPLPPTPGVSTARPAVPDARLGAGGIRPYSGNIVYPGTPNGRSVGNILSPGIPSATAQPIPSVVQPSAQPPRPTTYGVDGERRRHHGPVRRYAGDYPVYGFYAYPLVPNVIAVTGSTMTRAGAGYVVTVGDEPTTDASAEAAVSEAQTAETPEQTAAEPDYWLIALRGGLIYAVSDYAIESRALRFVTLQGDEYVVPLAELDRDFTVKLNQDRNVSINLD